MCGKALALIFILIAVVLAALASFLPADKIDYVIAISRFFDIMIPVLGVGALLKYLCPSNKNKCCPGGCSCNCNCCSGKKE